jgi:hypothetical protein
MSRQRRAVLAVAVLLVTLGSGACAARRPREQGPPLAIRPLPTALADAAPEPTPAAAEPTAAASEPTPAAAAAEPGAATAGPAAAADTSATAAAGEPPAGHPRDPVVDVPAAATAPGPVEGETDAGRRSRAELHELCHQPEGSGFLEESRRLLAETFCGATLWFDGLFGGEPDVRNARAVSGRVELSALHTDFHGFDYKARLRLNYDLPNLERRVRLFLGREEDDEFVADRQEGFAIRSSVFGLESEEEWLAGLGYSPPGRYFNKLDVRFGGRVKSAPEVFSQVRYRQNVFLGDRDVWRFRETVFWENRDGFGSTTSLDWDRVLRRDLILRWGNVGTISEATQGMAWRSAVLVYHNLGRWEDAAVAGEVFVRGESDAEVPLREYGTRAIFRQPFGRDYLFGEVIVGYTWPRERLSQERDGSAMVGFGIELLFGRDPW